MTSQLQSKIINEDNICARTLLTIIARGSAIITELYRLIELIPAPYRHYEDVPLVVQYLDERRNFTTEDLICDFRYFKIAEAFEAKIESNETLKQADEELCDNYIDILTRFYLTFESIHRYASDLNSFIVDLEEETFVGQSLDGFLMDKDGLQLLCEAYFILGYMLLATDNNFEGGLRERLVVSYYRYSSYKSSQGSTIDETCNLIRSTGFRSCQQQIYKTSSIIQYYRPEEYPEIFFGRVNVNQSVVNLIIAKIQTVDIYNQTVTAFPHPDHRSTALAQQASMLYVILYFCPNILKSQRSRMREITDKFFYDNWVISVHLGELVNLIEAWEPYKAARDSLVQLIEVESTQSLADSYYIKFQRTAKQLSDYLKEGWLNESSVLEHHARILNQIREANVVLRWMLLHTQLYPNWQSRLSRTVYTTVISRQPSRQALYEFLQDLSMLEKKFAVLYSRLVDEKVLRVEANKARALGTLNELVEMFTDSKPTRWIQVGANTTLVSLLIQLKANLEMVEFTKSNARDLIINAINDIEAAQESYSDGKNLQVVQLFNDLRDDLLQALKTLSLASEIKSILHSISDFSYAWRIMDQTFTVHMQNVIKDNPMKVYSIESTFIKLASAFDTHLLRIQQVDAQADLISVSQYYSTKLVSYIREVLHIIPATILELMRSIVSIQTESVMGDMPSKVSLEKLKDFALPEKRFQMLESTYKISHYAESMMMMKDTTIGLIKINSKQLLEDGIRRELVRRMSDSINEVMQFTDNSNNIAATAHNLINKLGRLNAILSGYKRSFEYIQDYLFIYGLRMWQEELSRIVKFSVEQAVESLINSSSSTVLGYRVEQQASLYQSARAPIPIYNPDPMRSSFVVRLLNEILKITDPKLTLYDEQSSTWYLQRAPRDKVADSRVFELIASGLSAAGLNGVDQICSSMLMLELQKLDNLIRVARGNKLAASQTEALIAAENLKASGLDGQSCLKHLKKTLSAALARVSPFSDRIMAHLLRIGQLQIIRSNIGCVLSTRCRNDSRSLYNCLETLNTTLLSVIRNGKEGDVATAAESSQQKGARYNDDNDCSLAADGSIGADLSTPHEMEVGLEDSQLIFELTNHLEWIGLSDPMSKIYTLSLAQPVAPMAQEGSRTERRQEQQVQMDLLFLVLLDQCSKFLFSRSTSGSTGKPAKYFYETTSASLDGQTLLHGLITLINHYQPSLGPSVNNNNNNSSDTNTNNSNNNNNNLSAFHLFFTEEKYIN